MKHIINRRNLALLCISLIFLSLSTNFVAANGGGDDEFEDNDNFATAAELTVGNFTNIALIPSDTYDYFWIDVEAEKILKIVIQQNQTEKKDMSLRNHITFFLLGMFLLGFFATAFELSHALIGFITLWYAGVLTVLVLYLLSAVLLNNRRLKKVMKILGVSKAEYNKLADKYYNKL